MSASESTYFPYWHQAVDILSQELIRTLSKASLIALQGIVVEPRNLQTVQYPLFYSLFS